MNVKLNLLIVDDHDMFIGGIVPFLQQSNLFNKIYKALDSKTALMKFKDKDIDFLIIDINLPDDDGLTLLEKIKKIKDCKILILTTFRHSYLCEKALKNGADGYLTKDNTHEELINAVEIILRNGIYVDKKILKNIEYLEENEKLYYTLSEREKEIFKLTAEGKTVKEIAGILGKSSKTIANQKLSMKNKMKIKSENDIIITMIALKLGIISF